MQSHGGLATVADAIRLAAGGVLSGPAGGVAAARHASRILDHGNLIAFDMGGTSTDMSLIVEGEAAVSTDRRVAGHRVALHSLDIASIGAGGGSIAHVDAGGVLHVGPASAGADPGPACYARDGTSPTVTDANLVLGFLDPQRFLGGRQRLDAEAAAGAVDTIAARLGIGRHLDTLVPGQRIEGPAIVESATTTVLLRAGDAARTTPHGWLDIEIAGA